MARSQESSGQDPLNTSARQSVKKGEQVVGEGGGFSAFVAKSGLWARDLKQRLKRGVDNTLELFVCVGIAAIDMFAVVAVIAVIAAIVIAEYHPSWKRRSASTPHLPCNRDQLGLVRPLSERHRLEENMVMEREMETQ